MNDKIFYHIYPLGFAGAPEQNDFTSPAGNGLKAITGHIPRLLELGINALYLGPVFESTAHGYDTLDYYYTDRRLGNNGDLKDLVRAFHDAGITVILDGVFNHTGRHFFAFRDLQEKGQNSAYRDWFADLDFSKRSPYGDPFMYEGWCGCYDLVKLNAHNPEVRDYLIKAAEYWIREFDIDGLRLDAANLLLPVFLEELSRRCKALKSGFWLMGEVVAGDYRKWANPTCIDSVTNYELYKGLWSSFNDRNFFELAWTLKRQSGPEGMYRDLSLYTFVDNHDVNRAASVLKNSAHLFPLYGLLFTLPGIPSIYYGSEYGFRGEKNKSGDRLLRPAWTTPEKLPEPNRPQIDSESLKNTIAGFIKIRKENPALRYGGYRELFCSGEQYAFMRDAAPAASPSGEKGETIIVAVNASEKQKLLKIPANTLGGGSYKDLLSGEEFRPAKGWLTLTLHPSWLRILRRR